MAVYGAEKEIGRVQTANCVDSIFPTKTDNTSNGFYHLVQCISFRKTLQSQTVSPVPCHATKIKASQGHHECSRLLWNTWCQWAQFNILDFSNSFDVNKSFSLFHTALSRSHTERRETVKQLQSVILTLSHQCCGRCTYLIASLLVLSRHCSVELVLDLW